MAPDVIPILPGTGRWQPAGLTERVFHLTQRGLGTITPSTTRCASGPPPRAGED